MVPLGSCRCLEVLDHICYLPLAIARKIGGMLGGKLFFSLFGPRETSRADPPEVGKCMEAREKIAIPTRWTSYNTNSRPAHPILSFILFYFILFYLFIYLFIYFYPPQKSPSEY
ncbi:hypothetical protein P170DRAFT_11234 [Aspergillus steynii IBT 23096]|uniref:Transmembrane protein n=1 Tax=Aspergillus steynii IBT 23096 TaxID=1392250 RepID=A0A2I2GMX7_9EURO|nr:uncharacterized protein P170DRAFT_11234 [Aspergillus steynii IBT 23096]PLB54242.1 hypothetical protein P170DRAFT_11234 [Aspergillus steynii IBT 23096]